MGEVGARGNPRAPRDAISARRRPAADSRRGSPARVPFSASRSRSPDPPRGARACRDPTYAKLLDRRDANAERLREAKGARTSAARTSSSDPSRERPEPPEPPEPPGRLRLQVVRLQERARVLSDHSDDSSSSGEEDLILASGGSGKSGGGANVRAALGAQLAETRAFLAEGRRPDPNRITRVAAPRRLPGSRRRLRPSSASGGVRARRRPASAAAFRSVPASAPVRSPPGGSLLPSDEVAFGAHFTREAEMARTLRDPRPKPRAPQARLTTVFDPPRLFTSSRPKERARNKAAMERAWRRQELTEMVVARTVGRIPGASGGEAFFSRRHWDDPLRAAAEAAAEAARRNYDARGEWGSVAADLAARDAARKAAAAAASSSTPRRGGGRRGDRVRPARRGGSRRSRSNRTRTGKRRRT